MRDTLFTAILTFTVLIAGTAAMGTELVRTKTAPRPVAAPVIVTLPAVTVTGRRPASDRFAADATAAAPRRVQ